MRVALVPRSAEIKPLFWRFVQTTLQLLLGKQDRGTRDVRDYLPDTLFPLESWCGGGVGGARTGANVDGYIDGCIAIDGCIRSCIGG